MGTDRIPRPRTGRLFLRDAVALLPGEVRDLPARLARSVSLAREFDLNLEITLDARFFVEKDQVMLDGIRKATSVFEGVVYHLHTSPQYRFGTNKFTGELRDFCEEQLDGGRLLGVCVHPDLVDEMDFLRPLVSDKFYVGVEVLDNKAAGFNTLASMADLLARHEHLGLVLDTAHIAGMQPQGEPPLEKYCELFADRIVEVHLSQTGNLYDPQEMGPAFSTDHSLLSLGNDEVADSLLSMAPVDNLIMVVEGVIPAGPYGNRLLEDELRSFADNLP